jgi:hypothetical protein
MRIAKPCCLLVLLTILFSSVACHKQAATESATAVEFYTPVDGAVGLSILPLQSTGGSHTWLATYTDESGTTKFQIELDPAATTDKNGIPASMGHGKFLSEPDSDPLPLLRSLKTALRVKHMPANAQKVDELPFDYALLGENQSRSTRGAYSSQPQGNWTTMKVFLPAGGDEGEVLLNINEVQHQAEFAIEDPRYGDVVLDQLEKVF